MRRYCIRTQTPRETGVREEAVDTNYRHEWKHEIRYADLLAIRARLRAIMQPDPHAKDGRYLIRSLYFDNLNDKARRSGFIVRGRTATKDQPAKEYFAVTADGTHVYVDDTDSDKTRRSGFLVTGRTATKDDDAASNYMAINSDGTHVYVDDTDSDKTRRSGFLVTGRTATKDDSDSYQNGLFAINGS